ncbi:DNA cytosine methyltransferase [Riemerella anatipestifer]|uniref:DNA cytosine methyltransferase n=1 Tax=Riemerella anatipestifer TaxID=34085 RepID=UPI0030BB951A
MNKINFIDLFAGASGLSEGFIKAGYNPIAHVEMDSDASFSIRTRSVYHYLTENNYKEYYTKYLKKEITREKLYSLVPNEIIDNTITAEIGDNNISEIFTRIKELSKGKKIDFIIGGPPCQAYSLIGRHQDEIENDPRNKLYIQYGRFLKEFSPSYFVFENVPGLLSAGNGSHLKNLRKYFKKIGYELDLKILNSADFGVLQNRKRVIIIGWKKEINFSYPEFDIENKLYKTRLLLEDLTPLKPGEKYDVIDYFSETNDYLLNSEIRNGYDFVTQHISRPHNQRDLEIYKLAINLWNKENRRLNYKEIDESLKTHKNEKSFLDRFKVVDSNGYSHTVVAHIAKDGHYYIHPDENQVRSISVREAARIQSFPDDFFFEGSRSAAFKQIGNAVPPLMAYKIAKKLKELI